MITNTTGPRLKPDISVDNPISSKPEALTASKRKVNTFADAETTKVPKSRTAEIPEDQIIDRPVIRVNHFSHSAINNPDWAYHHPFRQIYKYLMENDVPNLKAQLNLLKEDQVKSLWRVKICDARYASLPEAAVESKVGCVFFQLLFDRLTTEELQGALSESVDGEWTLLHFAVVVMEESLFNQLKQKSGMETLIWMLTRPVSGHIPPLAHACLYNESSYVFDTAIDYNRELIVKFLKGAPDIDESLLQFMLGDMASPLIQNGQKLKIFQNLLDSLDDQEFFEAVRFTGKKRESPLLLACKQGLHKGLLKKLVKSLDECQLDEYEIVELFTTKEEKNKSLLQKCFEINSTFEVDIILNSIRSPLFRFRILSVSTSKGHSIFQQLVHKCTDHTIEKIKDLLSGMNDNQLDQLITVDPNIWEQTVESTDHTLRQREQTPIVDAINRNNMRLAKYLWTKITDPDARINLLFYRSKHQTSLFQNMLETDRQSLEYELNSSRQSRRDLLFAQLFEHSLATESPNDACHYLKQISNSPFKTKLLDDKHKYFLASLCNHGAMITEDHFSDTTPFQCTDSVVHVLEKSLFDKKRLEENLLQLMTTQQQAGDKDAFVKWALSPLHGKQSPLLTVLNRFAQVYSRRNEPQFIISNFRLTLGCNLIEQEVRLTRQLFQAMMSMMSGEQIKEFLSGLIINGETLKLFADKHILATILDTLGDSGQAVLETIKPTTGENLLHLIFHHDVINEMVIQPCDFIKTVVWLDETYGLTSLLTSRLNSDGSTPLHVLLTSDNIIGFRFAKSPIVQKQILEHLCKSKNRTLLVELLKIEDFNGCTPLHKLFSYQKINNKIVDLLMDELGHETFSELMAIKDKQGERVLDYFSKKHSSLYEKYNRKVQDCRS
ncbi:hypothetical protein [Endozoicomonas sp. ONNA2]|uniref:hypothetical protein n=1 Tax=Endozoicomonas sp. ONNA2 TaxID=2828741 RepID=UPI002149607A|nr:hypothetical protein [Endozoicomonas sp. ONNA2]